MGLYSKYEGHFDHRKALLTIAAILAQSFNTSEIDTSFELLQIAFSLRLEQGTNRKLNLHSPRLIRCFVCVFWGGNP